MIWAFRDFRYLVSGMVLVSLGAMTGCASVPKSSLSAQDTNPEVKVSWANINATDSHIKPSQWWALFHDDTLSSLEQRAFQSNLDLQLAAIRWQESRAQLGLVSSQQGVQWSVDGGVNRAAYSQDNPLVKLGGPTSNIDTWTLSTSASWEVDLWGYLSYQEKAAQQALRTTALESAMAKVSLSADVARTYWRLRGAQAQEEYLGQQVDIAQEDYVLAQSREKNGVGTNYQTLAAKALVSDAKAKIPPIEHQIEQLKNALALLLGLTPHALNSELKETQRLPELPLTLPIGVPSELAKNRPDILMAQSRLQEAIAKVGAANADFYPRVRLTASFGTLSNDLSDLGDWDSRQYAFGPSFHLPLFEGGKLRQMLALTEAKQKEAALAYKKTVLNAWHEVEDSLSAWSSENQQVARLVVARTQREKAFDAAEKAYQQGAADRGDVLKAKLALVQAKQSVLNSKISEALAVIALYRSLGGSWNQSPVASNSVDKAVVAQ